MRVGRGAVTAASLVVLALPYASACGDAFRFAETSDSMGGSTSSAGAEGGAGGAELTVSVSSGGAGGAGGSGGPDGHGGAGGTGGAGGAGGQVGAGGSNATCPGDAPLCANEWVTPDAGLTGIVAIAAGKNGIWVATKSALYVVPIDDPTPKLVAGDALAVGYFDEVFGVNARFDTLTGLAVDDVAETVYLSDKANCVIRKVSIAQGGTYPVDTISGFPGDCVATDSMVASNVRWKDLNALALEPSGNIPATTLFVVNGNRIRKLDLLLKGTQAVAGLDGAGTVDSPDSAVAKFNAPKGLVFDAGTLLVGDTGSHRVRMVDLMNAGAVTSVCGKTSGIVEGPCVEAKFNQPNAAIRIPGTNSVIVSDKQNDRLRLVAMGEASTLVGGTDASKVGIGTDAAIQNPTAMALAKVGGANVAFVVENANAIRRIPLD